MSTVPFQHPGRKDIEGLALRAVENVMPSTIVATEKVKKVENIVAPQRAVDDIVKPKAPLGCELSATCSFVLIYSQLEVLASSSYYEAKDTYTNIITADYDKSLYLQRKVSLQIMQKDFVQSKKVKKREETVKNLKLKAPENYKKYLLRRTLREKGYSEEWINDRMVKIRYSTYETNEETKKALQLWYGESPVTDEDVVNDQTELFTIGSRNNAIAGVSDSVRDEPAVNNQMREKGVIGLNDNSEESAVSNEIAQKDEDASGEDLTDSNSEIDIEFCANKNESHDVDEPVLRDSYGNLIPCNRTNIEVCPKSNESKLERSIAGSLSLRTLKLIEHYRMYRNQWKRIMKQKSLDRFRKDALPLRKIAPVSYRKCILRIELKLQGFSESIIDKHMLNLRAARCRAPRKTIIVDPRKVHALPKWLLMPNLCQNALPQGYKNAIDRCFTARRTGYFHLVRDIFSEMLKYIDRLLPLNQKR